MPLPTVYSFASNGGTTNDVSTSYDGTNILQSDGGSLFAKVYGQTETDYIGKSVKNMNILNSGEMFTA